jgi:hypothetical protein
MNIILDTIRELALILTPLVALLILLMLLDVQNDRLLGLSVSYLTGAIVCELRNSRKP